VTVENGDDFAIGPTTTLFTLAEPFVLQDITSDGRRLLTIDCPTPADSQPIHVVADWTSLRADTGRSRTGSR
jgi:hypothetical protein